MQLIVEQRAGGIERMWELSNEGYLSLDSTQNFQGQKQ